MSQDKTKEEINYSEILVMLAKHYKDTKERYFDRHMKTCSMSNPNRRELTVFEQAEWQSFPLVQGTKLQNIVEKIATEPDFALPLQHQLTQAKGEIERLKEDNEQYAEEHEKSCNVTHNLHLLANDKRAEVIKLQSLLTQKDKEIAELKESENDFVLACNDYSDEVKELKKEIEALREGIESVIEKSAIQWINNDLTKLLNPSNEKGV